MTLVLAHRDGWMIADRRIMDGSLQVNRYRLNKIQRHPRLPLLVGCAGSMSNVSLIRDLLDESETDVESVVIKRLANLCRQEDGKNNSELLILTPTRLVETDHGGGIFELEAQYGAIGSGGQQAMAWNAGACAGRPLGLDLARMYVASVNVSVGDGMQVEVL